MCAAKRHVCFTLESGHVQCTRPCLLWANSGHRKQLGGWSELKDGDERYQNEDRQHYDLRKGIRRL